MSITQFLSLDQLRKALELSEKIESLEAELAAILGDGGHQPAPVSQRPTSGARKKRTMSAAAREKIAAAQRARWARTKGKTAVSGEAKAAKRKGGLTPEGRARLAAAMKARWAARKKGAPPPNAKR